MSTENYVKMMQSEEGIKKIKQLGKKLWPKQIMAKFLYKRKSANLCTMMASDQKKSKSKCF